MTDLTVCIVLLLTINCLQLVYMITANDNFSNPDIFFLDIFNVCILRIYEINLLTSTCPSSCSKPQRACVQITTNNNPHLHEQSCLDHELQDNSIDQH